jgi:hypothetical protein
MIEEWLPLPLPFDDINEKNEVVSVSALSLTSAAYETVWVFEVAVDVDDVPAAAAAVVAASPVVWPLGVVG